MSSDTFEFDPGFNDFDVKIRVARVSGKVVAVFYECEKEEDADDLQEELVAEHSFFVFNGDDIPEC